MISADVERPKLVSRTAHAAFEAMATKMRLRPKDSHVGGSVDLEWDQLRHLLAALPVRLDFMRVLDIGCNVGGAAILMAHLRARVTAIDNNRDLVALAKLNAERYGRDRVAFDYVRDMRKLPYPDGKFSLICCNNMLELVEERKLPAVQKEIDRVLAPGGMILVSGSGNRIWPRILGRGDGASPRGVWPGVVRTGFGPHYRNLDTADLSGFYARAQRSMGISNQRLRPMLWAAQALGMAPGLLAPTLCCLLRKDQAEQPVGAAPIDTEAEADIATA